MRWENASSTSNNDVYHLWNNDKKLLTLTLHPFSKTARVECAGEKRVFLIRQEGFFRNKTVLRNEYGIKIGELGQEDEANFIEVNGERFYYHTKNENESLAQLVLYKGLKELPVLVCGLNISNGNTSLSVEKDKHLMAHSSFLMALCWYMFLPLTKKNVSAVPI
jgi:hypothetical protein